MIPHITTRLARGAALVVIAALPLQACDTGILDVTDPDIVLNANSASGALALKNGVILRLAQAVNGVQGPDALFVYGGLITDEWRSGDTFVQRNNQDQRIWEPTNTFNPDPYRRLNRVRVEGQAAIPQLRYWLPDSTAIVGQMFALAAYVETLMGEHYCNGTPLSSVQGTSVVYGYPLTNDSMFALAAANADSALVQAGRAIAKGDSALANPTPADTAKFRTIRNQGVRIRNLASVVKGRALLDRGFSYFPAASAAVVGVPDTFKYQITHSTNSNTNQTWALNNSAKRYTMVDQEGGTGLDFISANDPRLPRATGTDPQNDLIFDSAFPLFVTRQGMWGRTSSVSIVTGVEAFLIQAEAALQGGSPGTWLGTINTLRTKTALYPPIQATPGTYSRGPNLTAIADTFASDSSRVNTNFRERAFWMFGTGHRLGDMRRLVRQYRRLESIVYPKGNFFKGGAYGTALMMPVPFDEQNNPNFKQCLDRSP